MPTYEYACRDCSEHIEVVQSFNDDPLETCGRCGGRLRKVFSAAGIIFKGSGYYVTDTRSERRSTSAPSTSGSGSSTSESSSESSSSKSESSSSNTSNSTSGSEGSTAKSA